MISGWPTSDHDTIGVLQSCADHVQDRYVSYVQAITTIGAVVGDAGIAPFLMRFPNLQSMLALLPQHDYAAYNDAYYTDTEGQEANMYFTTSPEGRRTCIIANHILSYHNGWTSDILCGVPTSLFDQVLFDKLQFDCRHVTGIQRDTLAAGYAPRHIEFTLTKPDQAQNLMQAVSLTGMPGVETCSVMLEASAVSLLVRYIESQAHVEFWRALAQIECRRTEFCVNFPLYDLLGMFASVAYLDSTFEELRMTAIVPGGDLSLASASLGMHHATVVSTFKRIHLTMYLPTLDEGIGRQSTTQIAALRTWIRSAVHACLRAGGHSCKIRLTFMLFDKWTFVENSLAVDRVEGDMTAYGELLREFNRTTADATGRHDDPLLALDFPVRDDLFTCP